MGKMDPWIEEFQELIDLGITLFQSSLESGSRIALILLDNCTEFMFKAYLRRLKRVVGISKKYPIKPTEWESKTSRRFDKLVEAMYDYGGLTQDFCDESLHYYSIRNDLYHTDTPIKPADNIFREQLKFVLDILSNLYKKKYTPKPISDSSKSIQVPIILKPQEASSDSLEEDFQLQIRIIEKKYRSYWQRSEGIWKVKREVLGPDKVLFSLLRAYPTCKSVKDISKETNLSQRYIRYVISGERGTYKKLILACDEGFTLSDQGLYHFIKMEEVESILFPEKS